MDARKQNFIERTLFSNVDTRYFAALRILIGFCLFLRICNMAQFADYHFSDAGWLLSTSAAFDGMPLRWSLLKWITDPVQVKIFFIAAAIFSLSFALGFFSRLSLILSYVFFVSICNRNFTLAYGGDEVTVVMLYFLFFSPLSERWSIDSFLQRRKALNFPFSWLLLLLQIQLSLVYFCSGWGKLHGIHWIDGNAITMVLVNPQFARFDLNYLLQIPWVLSGLKLITWATLVFEVLFPILVFLPITRFYTLIFGVLLHLGIAVFMEVGNFSVIMVSTYVLFLSPKYFDQTEILLKRVAGRWSSLWRQILVVSRQNFPTS